jgi:nitrous oxidase accessory protein
MVVNRVASAQNFIRISCFCIIIITLLVFLSISISAKTIIVDDGGGADFISIQDAINTANVSDTIQVNIGSYNENIIVNKSLTIIGSGKSNTIINGINSNSNTIKIIANNVFLSGFSIDNTVGQPKQYHCIFIQSSQYCTISDNLVKNGENGIYLISSSYNDIAENTIQNNNQKGIRLSSSNNNNICNNIIQSNGDGVYTSTSNSNNIYENVILNNGIGISLSAGSNNNFVYKNDFQDNTAWNAVDTGSNEWSKNNEGNYWDDYTGQDANEDGIGDTPYDINGGSNQDFYPLGYFVTQNQRPQAFISSISSSTSTQGQIVTFEGQVIDDGNIIQWEWTSSLDGIISNSEDFSTSTLSVGSHTIKFRAKDDQYQWSEYAISSLIVNPVSVPENQKPTAQIITINPSKTNYSNPVYFHGIGSDDVQITAFQWRSSIDGILSNQQTFTSSSLSVGTHIIYFKVRDNEGEWSNEDKKSLIIVESSEPSNSAPVPNLGGPYSGVVNTSVVFDASGSYDPDGDIFSYSWDFGDGSTGEGVTKTHLYSQIGNYTVNLTLTDSNDKTASISTYVNISKNPNGNGNEDSSNNGIPGFTFFIVIISIIIFLNRKKYLKK